MVLASLGAYAFVRLRFPGRDIIFVLVVATLAIPAYTVMIPLYRLMIAVRLVDTYLGVTLIYVSAFLPLALWLMRSVYQAMPVSVEEAAWLDGAGRIYALVFIVMPLAAPGLIASAILTFLSAWGQFLVPLVFSPTLATKPLTVLIPEFVSKNYVDYGLMNAAGMLAIVPPVLVVSVPQPIPGARPDGRLRQVTSPRSRGQGMNTTERVIREQFPFWARRPLLPQCRPTATMSLVGCGTSFYLAQIVAAAFNLSGRQAIAVPGAEWARRRRAYRVDDAGPP